MSIGVIVTDMPIEDDPSYILKTTGAYDDNAYGISPKQKSALWSGLTGLGNLELVPLTSFLWMQFHCFGSPCMNVYNMYILLFVPPCLEQVKIGLLSLFS